MTSTDLGPTRPRRRVELWRIVEAVRERRAVEQTAGWAVVTVHLEEERTKAGRSDGLGSPQRRRDDELAGLD